MRSGARDASLYGAIGGLFGAGAMSLLRLGARRLGLIDEMVPQAVEEWVVAHGGVEPPARPAGHHLLDQAIHAAYGVMAGALYGAALGRNARRPLALGSAFGVAVWLFGVGVLFPLLNIARPLWKSRSIETAVNLAAHMLYGTSVQLVAEELAQQHRRVTSDSERQNARVG